LGVPPKGVAVDRFAFAARDVLWCRLSAADRPRTNQRCGGDISFSGELAKLVGADCAF
jgi:hypothetical protein